VSNNYRAISLFLLFVYPFDDLSAFSFLFQEVINTADVRKRQQNLITYDFHLLTELLFSIYITTFSKRTICINRKVFKLNPFS